MGVALRLGLAGLILLAAGLLGTRYFLPEPEPPVPAKTASPAASDSATPEATVVGRVACASCHAEQDRLWQGSHHDLAMQEVTPETVLGDFNGTEFK
ncbi:hypothetical protein [Methyloterricola oryzae]|uniref:hypothetical protein n=1 Tax=Methyloterricola oryzae TaxID=1495050 RepID=UPI00069AA6B8|nr:hypothetical protein [Methyloterricola oryzae]